MTSQYFPGDCPKVLPLKWTSDEWWLSNPPDPSLKNSSRERRKQILLFWVGSELKDNISKTVKNVFDKRHHLNTRGIPLLSSKNKIMTGSHPFFFFCFHGHLGWATGEDQDSSFTICPKVLRTLSYLLNPFPQHHPKFLFTHQRKLQPKGKEFSSHWSRIQEFICLKVWSQAKLCYLGMVPKYRSVLCFESWNHQW